MNALLLRRLLERLGVARETHRIQPVVDVDRRPGDSRRERRAQERRGLANLHRGERLLVQRRVGHGVVDHVVDEADRLRRPGPQRPGGDGVHANAPLSPRLVRENLGVGLERSLRGGHAAAVARDDPLGREVRERDARAARVHERAEPLEHGDVRVRRRGHRGEVAVAARLEEGLHHLRPVRERVHEDVDLPKVLLHLSGALRDGPLFVPGVALVREDVLGNVVHRVVDRVHGVHLRELHEGAVGELPGLVELTAAEGRLEDVQRGDPRAEDDLRARLLEALGDGPAEALVVRDAGDESLLACDDRHGRRGVMRDA
eukprot:31098-Pelagococcus_subviridis.AAC.6